MVKVIALLTILVSCFFDPIRDATYGKVSWWEWHAYKWIAFYTPLVYIVLREWWPWQMWTLRTYPEFYAFRWKFVWYIVGIAIAAWLTWQAGMAVSGAGWESMWVRLIKGWF